MPKPLDLHRAGLTWSGDPEPESDSLGRDLLQVWNSDHQGMVVYGPWMEARVSHMVRSWLPEGWWTSGPSQLHREDKPGLRSRSWDVVVHRYPLAGAGPEAAPGAGYPLLPLDAVCAVIDTKTNFSTPAAYGAAVAYDLMNQCQERQLDYIGPDVAKMMLVATSSRSPDAMRSKGESVGLQVFSLGRYEAGPVADGADRALGWRFCAYHDGAFPFQAFKTAVIQAVNAANSKL